MMKQLIGAIKFVVIIYFILMCLAFIFQRNLIFIEQKYNDTPSSVGLTDFTEVKLTTADNITVYGWYHRSPSAKKTIIYFDGNASRLPHNAEIFKNLADKGYGVLGIAYRGYGKSGGKATEAGFYADARAAVEFAKKSAPENSIIVAGRSIGTGVAVEIAKEYNLGGVVLISPYTSITNVAAKQYWFFPVKFLGLVHYKFDSLSKIKSVNEPLLLIHGDVDTIIPISFGKELFAAANNPKKFVIFQNSDHNDLDTGRIAIEIDSWINNGIANSTN